MKKRKITYLLSVVAMSFLGIQLATAQSPNPPTTLPAAPTHDAADVLSIYGSVYTLDPGAACVFSNSESTTSITEETILGEKMWFTQIGTGGTPSVKYGSVVITFDTPLDITNYNVVFMDIYAVEQNSFNLRVRFNGEEITHRIATGWNKLEIDMNDYRVLASAPDFSAISSIELVGEGARNIYMDNIYAYNGRHSELADAPSTSAPSPIHAAANVLPVFTDFYTNEIGVKINTATAGDLKKIKAIKYGSALDKMIYVTNSSSGNGGLDLLTQVDVTDYDSLHFDVYPIGNTIPMRIVIGGFSTKSSPVVASAATANAWNSIDVSLADLAVSVLANNASSIVNYSALKDRAFWLFQSTGGKRSFYLDNVYFYKEADPGPITNIKETSLTTSVSVYPNPVIDILTVNSEIAVNTARVFTLAGQTIKTVQGNEVDLSGVANGVYLLKISLEDGSVVTKKIIK